MSKKNVNQLVINQDEMSESTVETLLSKTIGRKRSGTVRMQYIHSSDTYGERIRTLASIISYKFYREMTSLEHMVDDRPMVDDLIGADLPWTGLVKCKDEVMDERYRIEGHIRSLIQVGDFVFQIRDIKDGSPYSDGLVIFDVKEIEGTGEVKVSTSTGLKQIEVVELFQGYDTALLELKEYLRNIGYIDCRDEKYKMILSNDGDHISTIDIHLVGTTRLK